jgi:hypothetical protein
MSWNWTKRQMLAAFWPLLGLIVPAGDDRAAEIESSTLIGVVKFDGPRPERKPIQLKERGGKLSECAKMHATPPLRENAIISDKGGLGNVFVYVKKGPLKKTYPVPQKPVVLDQKKCMFRPHVQGIRVGQQFLMRNSDSVIHNVRSHSLRNRAFNIAQPADTPDRKKTFTKGERAIKMKCDIHGWMTAYVFAMEHPFFAVSDEKGQFKIEGLPAGEYTVAAWHEEFGDQESQITIAASGSTEFTLSFKKK